MALPKQTITLDFGFGGLDQKSDPKLVQRVKFSQLENVRSNKIGRIDRRNGTAASLTSEISAISGSTVTVVTFSQTISKLISDGDNMFAIAQTDPPKPYRASLGDGYLSNRQMISSGAVTSYIAVSELRAIDNGTATLFSDPGSGYSSVWDRADSTTHACFVYSLGGTDKIRVEIRDKASQSLVRSIHRTGYNPVVISHPDGRDHWVISYSDTTSITASYSFQTFGLTTSVTAVVGMTSTTSIRNGSLRMVAVSDANQALSAMICAAYIKSSGLCLMNGTWPATDGSGAALSTTSSYMAEGGASGGRIALCANHNPSDTSSSFRVYWHVNTTITGVYTATFNRSLTVVLGNTLVNSISTDPSNMTGCQLASGKSHVMVQYGTSVTGGYIYGYETNASNTSSFLWVQNRMSLQSKAMVRPNGETPYFWMGYCPTSSDTTQATLFLAASVTPSVASYQPPTLGRMFHCTAWQGDGHYNLPSLIYDGSEYVTMHPALSALGLSSSRTDSLWRFNEIRFAASATSSGWASAANRSEILIGGGILSKYNPIDGVIANGPQLFPMISLSATNTGSLTTGSYAVTGIFEYIDSSGRVSRSAPALPVTFAITGAQTALVASCAAYPLGDGLIYIGGNTGGTLRFVAYRTLVNESQVYYRCGMVTMVSANTANTVQITLSDTFAAAEEPIYTTGGVIENWQPSAPLALATNGRRVLAVPGDRPNFVMQSKPIVGTDAVHFMEEVGRNVTQHGDRIYALASHQDRWYAFKERGIFVATGDGADITGQNDSLSEFETIVTGYGCTQPRSVVSTPAGVVFRSQKGFFLLVAGGAPSYIGDAVEDYTSPVKDSAYDAKNEICYFTLVDGTELVLSFFQTSQGVDPRWSIDSTFALNSSAVIDGVRYYAMSTPYGGIPIFKETPGVYTDAHSATTVPDMKMTTAWAEPAGMQGLARIYKALFMGQFPSTQPSTTVTIEVGYNYATTFAETHTVSSANWQQDGEHAQFVMCPQRTKCEAIRFRITQSIPASDYRGLWLNQILLEVGIKSGSNQLKAAATARKS